MELKKNVLANYLGQGWRVLMSVAFIPLFIKYLGIEAYGLIGIFFMLQAWLGLLDMGMRPALGREMARLTGGGLRVQFIWDLLRTIEFIGIALAVVIAVGIWASSNWFAVYWVTANNLPVDVVTRAFAVMGIVIALSFIESIYVGCIVGLQRQVLLSAVASIMATLRGLGAVGVLAWVSPSIEAFFIWQGVISFVSAAIFAGLVYRLLPTSSGRACFSRAALIGIWRFAAGMMLITLLSLLLHQVDKVLLSRLLTLEVFGYYVLAGVMVGAVYTLGGPIATAFFPRFTELATRGDEHALCTTYHLGAQLVTVFLGSAAIVLMIFGDRVLLLWTSDQVLTSHVAPLVVVLALGALLQGLMWMPFHLQIAHGWTTLTIKISSVAVAVLVPTILWIVPVHGAIGAACAWMILSAGYLPLFIHLMHQRLLPTEKWRWYREDIGIPLFAATATAGLCRWLMPEDQGRFGEFCVLLASSGCVLIMAALAAPLVRNQLTRYTPGRIGQSMRG